MFQFKIFSIAVIIAAFMFVGFVKSGEAIEIVDFPSDTEDSSYGGGYTYHMAFVKTDVPIYHVSWYIDDSWVYGETLDRSTSFASYYPYDKIPGRIEGVRYKIGVKVWEWDADDAVFRSTTASYTVRMFEPKYTTTPTEPKDLSFVSGYVEISKQTYDYATGYMSFDYSVSACHSGTEDDGNVNLVTEYKASFPNLNIENKDFRPNAGQLKPKSGKRYFSDSGSIGITLRFGFPGRRYNGEAYVRLIASSRRSDNYFLTHILECVHPE